MNMLIAIVIYIVLAAAHVAGLYIAAIKFADAYKYDVWPIVCGIFWPVAGPIAAAYIAAKWFVDTHK